MVVSIPKEKKKNLSQTGLAKTLALIIKMKTKKNILFERKIKMKIKWIIMQELEDTNCANPYLIVDSEKRAEELCYQLESQNPGFIFWTYMCEEE